MRRFLPLAAAALLLLVWGGEALAQDAGPRVSTAVRVNTSEPLRDLPNRPGHYRGLPYAVPNKFHRFDRDTAPEPPAGFVDPVLDMGRAASGGGTLLQSFEGVDEDDNRTVARAVVPPDANGDVGPNHYVQWVNLAARIFDKNGNLLLGPVPGNHFFQGLGGPCETQNDGDPVTLYDHLSDRWVVMQFMISSGDALCVAVSATPDPTGAFHQYQFNFSDFPDYPKLGVWSDAYYATTRSFGSSFRQEAVAFERDRMLQGLSAQMVVFLIPRNGDGSNIDGFLPADLDGPAPPPGTPGLFVGGPVTSPNRLRIYGLSVNWSNPSASTFTLQNSLTPASYDRSLGDVRQPSPGEQLATLSFTLMHRVQYRNFGGYQTLMLNHTVDAGSDRAGVRWYELRKSGSNWSIYQQGTYAPNDGLERWIGSIAMNGQGDIGLAYSTSSTSQFPSLHFTGQTADQSGSGVMNVGETLLHAGTGAQRNSFNRWGDYSSLSVDPTDDRTFWFTSEYYQTTGSFDFKTRIASFQLPGGTGGCDQTLSATLDNTTPAPGDLITFTVTLTNNSASSAPVDLWVDASGPTSRRILLGSGTLLGSATVTRNVGLRVPSGAPSGAYTLDLNVGTFGPDTICDTETFAVNVSAPVGGALSRVDVSFEAEGDFFADDAALASASVEVPPVLAAASPNPFRAATTLVFTLPEAADVTLAVFDMLGRRVALLHDGLATAGPHTVAFDASDLPSGPYVVRLTTSAGTTQTQRITLLR